MERQKAYDMTYTYLDYGEVPAGKSDDAMMAVIERAAKKVPWFEKIYFEGNVGGTDDAAAMLTKSAAERRDGHLHRRWKRYYPAGT